MEPCIHTIYSDYFKLSPPRIQAKSNIYKQIYPQPNMVKKRLEHADNTAELQKKLIENLIDLQKANLHMIDKFDRLSKEIGQLLNLFEVAARSFAHQPANMSSEKDKEFLNKIDRLLEQNKTIAKGLTLMEERIRERVYGPQHQQQKPQEKSEEKAQMPPGSRPLPRI